MASVCHAVGVLKVTNSGELHDKPFGVVVQQQKKDPRYTEVTNILNSSGIDMGTGKVYVPPVAAAQAAPSGDDWGDAGADALSGTAAGDAFDQAFQEAAAPDTAPADSYSWD